MKEENGGILKKIIRGYNDSRMAIFKKLVENTTNIQDENSFLDDGTIKARIELLKSQYKKLVNELELASKHGDGSGEDRVRKVDLFNKLREVEFDMAFFASNNFEMIDSCLDMTKNANTNFKMCLLALKLYMEGNEKDAFLKFYEYFKDKDGLLEHYLVNKTYGTLLYKANQYNQAKMLLQHAVTKRPEDKELHVLLKDIYKRIGQEVEEQIETNIIELLG